MAPDGRQILFYNRYDLLVRNSDGTGLVRRFVDVSSNPYIHGAGMRWSPDGRRIAFVCKDDEEWQLCVANADGSGLIGLGISDPYSFDWSPDGRWIAYSAKGGIYVIRSDGGGQPVRIREGYALYLNWLPE